MSGKRKFFQTPLRTQTPTITEVCPEVVPNLKRQKVDGDEIAEPELIFHPENERGQQTEQILQELKGLNQMQRTECLSRFLQSTCNREIMSQRELLHTVEKLFRGLKGPRDEPLRSAISQHLHRILVSELKQKQDLNEDTESAKKIISCCFEGIKNVNSRQAFAREIDLLGALQKKFPHILISKTYKREFLECIRKGLQSKNLFFVGSLMKLTLELDKNKSGNSFKKLLMRVIKTSTGNEKYEHSIIHQVLNNMDTSNYSGRTDQLINIINNLFPAGLTKGSSRDILARLSLAANLLDQSSLSDEETTVCHQNIFIKVYPLLAAMRNDVLIGVCGLIQKLQNLKPEDIFCSMLKFSTAKNERMRRLKHLMENLQNYITRCSLALHGDKSWCGLFIDLLEHQDSCVRSAAVITLKEMALNNPCCLDIATELLIDMFNDDMDIVRTNALKSLSSLGRNVELNLKETKDILFNIKEDHQDFRYAIYELLGSVSLGDQLNIDLVLQHLFRNLRMFLDDREVILNAIKKLSLNNFNHIDEAFIHALLGFNPTRIAAEPNWKEVTHEGKIVFISNIISKKMYQMQLPTYFRSHYEYLRQKYPNLLPLIDPYLVSTSQTSNGKPVDDSCSKTSSTSFTGLLSGLRISKPQPLGSLSPILTLMDQFLETLNKSRSGEIATGAEIPAVKSLQALVDRINALSAHSFESKTGDLEAEESIQHYEVVSLLANIFKMSQRLHSKLTSGSSSSPDSPLEATLRIRGADSQQSNIFKLVKSIQRLGFLLREKGETVHHDISILLTYTCLMNLLYQLKSAVFRPKNNYLSLLTQVNQIFQGLKLLESIQTDRSHVEYFKSLAVCCEEILRHPQKIVNSRKQFEQYQILRTLTSKFPLPLKLPSLLKSVGTIKYVLGANLTAPESNGDEPEIVNCNLPYFLPVEATVNGLREEEISDIRILVRRRGSFCLLEKVSVEECHKLNASGRWQLKGKVKLMLQEARDPYFLEVALVIRTDTHLVPILDELDIEEKVQLMVIPISDVSRFRVLVRSP
mmetsp:Transcript_12890/g.14163  ORF Transcript_12890/g.14163 Transcript_12890/m.14163 type:complete len:1036 (-) Transcript_12890:1149-4256(-)